MKTLEKLTDEISTYIASKIPNIETHTLNEIAEYIVYKTHNFAVDCVHNAMNEVKKGRN